MQFNATNVSQGPMLRLRGVSLTGVTNTTTCTSALGTEYVIGNSVNVQLRVVSCDQKVTASGTLMKAIQLYVKVQSRDTNVHSVVVHSETLRVHRFLIAEPAAEALVTWQTIYNKMVDTATWRFDLDVICMEEEANDTVTRRLALALLQDEDTTDVQLVGVNGTVRAHGYVLAAASEYMRAAFYGEFAEARDKRLHVPDANVQALQLIKKFAYTGYVDPEPCMLATLLPLASRFLMTDLARACTASLAELAPDDLIPLLHIDLKSASSEGKPAQPPLLMIEMLSRIDNKLEAIKNHPENGGEDDA